MDSYGGFRGLARLTRVLVVLAAFGGVAGSQSVGTRTTVGGGQSGGVQTTVRLTKGSPARFEAGPPTSLGQRSIGPGTRPGAMLSVSDSIVRGWGWTVASVDPRRHVLRTEWLYFAGTGFTPDAGGQCEDGAVVGLRLEIALRRVAKDSADFVVRGEAVVVDGTHRTDAERFARGGFATLGSALQAGARSAGQWPDTLSVDLERVSGEMGARNGRPAHGCVGVRP
ncbi:MAG: hypothetical protein ACYC3L_15970 [Gemmatimonadaceae bacterium]